MSNNEKTMVCPFCDEQLRFGVKVCRGCQAEITYDYGKSGDGLAFLIVLASIYVMFFTSVLGDSFFDRLTNFWFFVGLLTNVVLIVGLTKSMKEKKEPQAKFERRQFR